MVADDIAFDIGGIGRLFLSDHLTMIIVEVAPMIAIMVIDMRDNQRMMIAISMVMRP
jgi:hypothetical protein